MARQPLDILNPIGGVDRSLAFQFAPPYTSPDLMNVWPRDVFSRRRRCGSRPGLKKAFFQQASGTSFDLIAEVREATGTKGTPYVETFDSALTTPPWTSMVAWGAPYSPSLPKFKTSQVYGGHVTWSDDTTSSGHVGAIRDALTPTIDTAKEYTFTAIVAMTITSNADGYFDMWVRMNDTTPLGYTDGVRLRMVGLQRAGQAADGQWGLYCNVYDAGSEVTGDAIQASITTPAALTVVWEIVYRIAADNTADKIIVTARTLNLPQASSGTFTKTLATTAAGEERWGFSIGRSAAAPSNNPEIAIQELRLSYTGDSAPVTGARNRIFVIANDADYEEDNAGTLVSVASGIDNAGTDAVTGADAITAGNDLTVGRLLQAVDLRGVLYIVNHSGDANATFIYYNPASDALKGGVFSGSMPKACELIASYRDALLLAGKRGAGQEWYLCKRGADPTTDSNWTPDTSVISAVVGSLSESGRIGEPITALMRHSDDYMLFGCHSSVWVLRGDPNIGGTIDVLDPRHGVISATAHCRGPATSTFFLALDGLYAVPYGAQTEPIALSKKLPQELRYLSMAQNRVFLAYDVFHEGIVIAVTRTDGSRGSYFFYDMDTQGFFPMEFPSHCEPTFLHYYSADSPGQRAVLFGGRDGYIRQFDDFGKYQTDDGIDWTSRMTIGPILLAPSGYMDGVLREAIPQTAEFSGDVSVAAQVGDNAEKAFSSVLHNGFTAYAGTQRTWRPNLRGNAAYVTFSSTGGTSWAMEKLTVVREPMGKLRV